MHFITEKSASYRKVWGTGFQSKPLSSLTSSALEIQEALVELACRNVALNNLQQRIKVMCQDLRMFSPGRKYDIVFAKK